MTPGKRAWPILPVRCAEVRRVILDKIPVILLALIPLSAMSQAITVRDMASAGVRLLRNGDLSFASALSPNRSPSTDVLLPYAVVVSNETARPILAYSVRWKCSPPNGKAVIKESTIFDQATLRVLEPRSRQLVTSVPGMRSWYHDDPQVEAAEARDIDGLLAFYQQQEHIDVSLELVIFSDGEAIGDDPGSWVPRIRAWVNAERDLAHEVQAAGPGDLQGTLATISDQALAALATPELKQIGLALAANRAQSYREAYGFAKGDFAAQMLESIQRNGSAAALDFVRDLLSKKTWPDIHY